MKFWAFFTFLTLAMVFDIGCKSFFVESFPAPRSPFHIGMSQPENESVPVVENADINNIRFQQ